MKKIFIGSDHAGFLAKEEIKKILKDLNYNSITNKKVHSEHFKQDSKSFEDLGTYSNKKKVDYVDFAKAVSNKVILNKNSFGILICGTGTGMEIAANKIDGIRAAFCYDEYSAKMSRLDNDANVLTLRAREFNHHKYKKLIKIFLETKFSRAKRHLNRIKKLFMLE